MKPIACSAFFLLFAALTLSATAQSGLVVILEYLGAWDQGFGNHVPDLPDVTDQAIPLKKRPLERFSLHLHQSIAKFSQNP